jgi:hypothetical protein
LRAHLALEQSPLCECQYSALPHPAKTENGVAREVQRGKRSLCFVTICVGENEEHNAL